MADVEIIKLNGEPLDCADKLYRNNLPILIISFDSTNQKYVGTWKGDVPIPSASSAPALTSINCIIYSETSIIATDPTATNAAQIYIDNQIFKFNQTGLDNAYEAIYSGRLYLGELLLKAGIAPNIRNYIYVKPFCEYYAPLDHLSSTGNTGVATPQYYGHVKATSGLIKRFSYNVGKYASSPAPYLELPTLNDDPSLAIPQVIEVTCTFLALGKDNAHPDYFWLSNQSNSGLYYKVLGMGNQYRYNFKKDPASATYYFPYNVRMDPFFNPHGIIQPASDSRDYEAVKFGYYNGTDYEAAEGILMRLYVSANISDIENIDDYYEITNGSVTTPTVTTSAGAGVPPFNVLL